MPLGTASGLRYPLTHPSFAPPRNARSISAAAAPIATRIPILVAVLGSSIARKAAAPRTKAHINGAISGQRPFKVLSSSAV